MKELLREAGGHLPPPDTPENIQAYLKWDDWRVLDTIAEGQAKDHGEILRNRNHYRLVYWMLEVPSIEELWDIHGQWFFDIITVQRCWTISHCRILLPFRVGYLMVRWRLFVQWKRSSLASI
jgi:hypothetical protein